MGGEVPEKDGASGSRLVQEATAAHNETSLQLEKKLLINPKREILKTGSVK